MALLNTPLQFISSIPPAARGFTLLLATFSILSTLLSNYSPEYDDILFKLIPGLTLWRPWTLITSSFAEGSIIEFLVSLLVLPPSLRYLERLWGAIETVKFVLVVLVVSNVITVIVSVVEHVVIGLDGLFLFGTSYRGLQALQTGILVAFTQIIPEHQVLLFGAIGVRVKRLPMLYVTFSNVMCIIGYQSPYILIQFGWLVSWVYLRFYKRTGGDIIGGGAETWGDRSDTFAFVHWFPPLLHTPVTHISNIAYKVCTRVGLVKAYPDDFDLSLAGSGSGSFTPLPGGARAEAERRRAMALKVLDQRLASTATPSGGASVTPPNPSSTLSSQAPPAVPNGNTSRNESDDTSADAKR